MSLELTEYPRCGKNKYHNHANNGYWVDDGAGVGTLDLCARGIELAEMGDIDSPTPEPSYSSSPESPDSETIRCSECKGEIDDFNNSLIVKLCQCERYGHYKCVAPLVKGNKLKSGLTQCQTCRECYDHKIINRHHIDKKTIDKSKHRYYRLMFASFLLMIVVEAGTILGTDVYLIHVNYYKYPQAGKELFRLGSLLFFGILVALFVFVYRPLFDKFSDELFACSNTLPFYFYDIEPYNLITRRYYGFYRKMRPPWKKSNHNINTTVFIDLTINNQHNNWYRESVKLIDLFYGINETTEENVQLYKFGTHDDKFIGLNSYHIYYPLKIPWKHELLVKGYMILFITIFNTLFHGVGLMFTCTSNNVLNSFFDKEFTTCAPTFITFLLGVSVVIAVGIIVGLFAYTCFKKRLLTETIVVTEYPV